ncbi:uncharacterized protein MELLADRAFT_106366 [Melampsora larici-populina 98AG31]|uniref:CxC1-like cysteine cluster associated with KDZ transposases domain-containing protein n=1 Tax=Melampsora larici-populina (strain 98AG31 / pathotype 3-4-7) TaxID=747676 RepID=F4RL52_MELLP|nr:uncharacterized protein MELLADRAFT_106366 [Melampsora larici-populina 98AG31]EGG06927.1 hypothetical protein MELLADRAFT_106366 [Melampsora larici-populina 98AG31]
MPSHRLIRGLNHRPKQPKASTPLQRQLELSRTRDLEHAEAADAEITHRLNNPCGPHHPIGEVAHLPEPGDENDNPAEERSEDDEEIDLTRFMPMPHDGHREDGDLPDLHDDPIMAGLRRELHLADRLANEKRWSWQYAIMLPTFLRRRLQTSNWGNQVNWNEDVGLTYLARRRVKRLLQMGYIAASPSRPRTAFSVRLMVHHYSQWIRFAIPTEGYCQALDDMLNNGSPEILTPKGHDTLSSVRSFFHAWPSQEISSRAARKQGFARKADTARSGSNRGVLSDPVGSSTFLAAESHDRGGKGETRTQKLAAMNAGNAPIRTAEQRHELLDLPASLVALEAQIQAVADELGNAELLNARRGSNVRVKAMLSVQVALGFLYEAAMDVIQQRADAAVRTGATQQPRNEQLRKKKQILLKKKLDTYLRHASRYNQRHRPTPRLVLPSLDEVLEMDLLHPFWDEVALNHLDEPWASCQRTKDGIVALRNQLASEEELRRLAREVRQLMGWAIDYQNRVDRARPNEHMGKLLAT